MTIAAALAAAVAYLTVRFLDSRRELRMLQKADLVCVSCSYNVDQLGVHTGIY